MDKEQCLARIAKVGIIAVIRANSKQEALKLARAVQLGGIEAIEVTMTTPGALELIEHLAQANTDGRLIIGAGTVLDAETTRNVLLSGAEFVVSPALNLGMVQTCNRYRKLCMPGAMTLTEIIAAMESGADVVKIFPGSILGPGFIKAVKGPLPQAQLVPTGGVSLENVDQWIRNGCVAVGVGGELTKGAKEGNYEQITATALSFVEKIRTTRNK